MAERAATPSLKDFIRVVKYQREQFPSNEAAAEALGYGNVNSFRQRLTKERQRYPEIFEGVPSYRKTTPRTNRLADGETAQSIDAELAKMFAQESEDTESAEGADGSEQAEGVEGAEDADAEGKEAADAAE